MHLKGKDDIVFMSGFAVPAASNKIRKPAVKGRIMCVLRGRAEHAFLSSCRGKGESMVTIVYEGQSVLVTQEVADFLEQDDKRLRSQARSDRRHLVYSRMDPDAVIATKSEKGVNYVLNEVIRNLGYEQLWHAVSLLPLDDQLLVEYRYRDGLTQQQIGDVFGITKMAVCKRLNRLHGKLRVMLSASSFLLRRSLSGRLETRTTNVFGLQSASMCPLYYWHLMSTSKAPHFGLDFTANPS